MNKTSRFLLTLATLASLVSSVSTDAACPFVFPANTTARLTVEGVVYARFAVGVNTNALFANVAPSIDLSGASAHINANRAALDIDGDGAFTNVDALIIARYLAGLNSDAMVAGITFASNAQRKIAFDVNKYITDGCLPASGAPKVLYTDITSGPNVGGENNKGIYLSIFGKNFGSSGLGSTVKVFLNDVEVDNYRYLGASKGRSDIQQITVQIGAVGIATNGTTTSAPLPIKVVVDSVASNTDQTFVVNPGRIYFVDNVNGIDSADLKSLTDSTARGTFAAPFKSVQKSTGATLAFVFAPASTTGAWGRVQAGDFIVMRGTGTPWAREGFGDYFLQTLNKSGCAVSTICVRGNGPGGTATGPITLMAYPTEDVFINGFYEPARDSGTISSADSRRILDGAGHWINIVNLRVEGGNHDGAVNLQAGGSNWRVINNELTAATAVTNPTARAGGISGDSHLFDKAPGSTLGTFLLGNNIHDVFCGPDDTNGNFENHGIYLQNFGTYEIAYNTISKIRGGNGIQSYGGGNLIDGLNFHHNIIQNVGKHGINIADGSRAGFKIWNNVVLDTDLSALRFNAPLLVGAQIFNNTFYNVDLRELQLYGAVRNEDNFAAGNALDMRNNIFVPVTKLSAPDKGEYTTLAFPLRGTVSHNLWFDGVGDNPALLDPLNSLAVDPQFVSALTKNVRLKSTSPARDKGSSASGLLNLVNGDFDALLPRPQGSAVDVGAFEFKP